MKAVQHHRAMEALCRQREKIYGVDDVVRLTEAEILARLAILEYRQRLLGEESPPIWKAP